MTARTSTPGHEKWITCATRCALLGALPSVLGVVTACDDEREVSASVAALTVECVSPDAVPANAWVCPADRTLECGADDVLFIADDETTSCAGEEVVLSDDGPFAPGEHVIVVSDADGVELCSSQLTVVDTEPPVLESHTLQLWPPNHKLHEIAVEDCVSVVDACDGELDAEFVWASSDEPIDALGDGHHAPDIGRGADGEHVCVRSERQGGSDGRVYKLGVRVVDASGNESLGECLVIVDHDQRGVTGSDSGEAYRLAFSDTDALEGCGGDAAPPPPPPPPPPPAETDAGTGDAGMGDAGGDEPTVPGPE
jgi:hypothetical protein